MVSYKWFSFRFSNSQHPGAMSTYSDSDSAKIAIITVHSLLTIVNIVGNSLVCVVIMKNTLMRYVGD